MTLRLNKYHLYKFLVFLLPFATIITQWLYISGLRVSWLLTLVLLFLNVLQYKEIKKCREVLFLSMGVIIIPCVTYALGILSHAGTYSFNFSLYISLFFGLVYCIYIYTLSDDMYEVYIYGCAFSCSVFVIWAIFEMFTGYYFLSTVASFTQRLNVYNMHYPITAFANVNDFAQYLVILFSVSSSKIWKKSKVLWGIGFILLSFVVFHTQSRLALMVLFVVFPLAFVLETILCKDRKKWMVQGSILAIIIICYSYLECFYGITRIIFRKIIDILLNADFVNLRMEIYIRLIEQTMRAPLGEFGSAYISSQISPHNIFLFIVCDFGWIATILFLIFLIGLCIGLINKIKSAYKKQFDSLLLAMLLLFPIWGIISSVNEQRKITWIFLGICIHRVLKDSKRVEG